MAFGQKLGFASPSFCLIREVVTKKSFINCTASHKHGKPAACTVLLFTISVLCSVVHFTVRPQTHSESCVEITNMTFQLIHLPPQLTPPPPPPELYSRGVP